MEDKRKPSSTKACIEDESRAIKEKEEENCEPPSDNDSFKDGHRFAKKKKNKKGKRSSGKDESCHDEKKDERRRKTPAAKYAGKAVLFFIAEKAEEHSKPSVR